jgi:hypothetical protein
MQQALWLRQGEIAAFGDVENVLSRYKGEFGTLQSMQKLTSSGNQRGSSFFSRRFSPST